MSYGSIQAAKQSGLRLTKVWLSTPDGRTRADHRDADGQEVGIDEMFDVGGEELAYPGDPSGSASNVCQCRCTTYYNTVEDAEDNVITDGSDSEEEKQREPIAISNKRERREEYRRYMEAYLG